MFSIDRQSGLITVLKPRLLDREIQEQLEFQVSSSQGSCCYHCCINIEV